MSEGKCPDCYGDGVRWLEPPEKCALCGGSGLVEDNILAQREAEYRAWCQQRRKSVSNRAHSK